MIRPVSHPGTGRRFDLASATAADIAFLRELHENLPSREHGLICDSAQHGDQDIYVYRRDGHYWVRHFKGAGHHGDHRVVAESDEHKRGKDYTAGELERSGISAAQEVRTNNGAVLDVATLDAPRFLAVEFQAFNDMADRDYKARTTRIAHATAFTGQHSRPVSDGVLPMWVHAFGMPRKWAYPVPSIAAQDTSWQVMPKPGTVNAIGPRVIQARQCKPGSWDSCPVRGRNWCGNWHPWARAWVGEETGRILKVGDVAAMAANKQLVPLRHYSGAVYFVTPEDAALYAELGGTGTWAPGSVGERQSARYLKSCRWRPYEPAPDPWRIPVPPTIAEPPIAPAPRLGPWRCSICGAQVTVAKIRCDSCNARIEGRGEHTLAARPQVKITAASLDSQLGPWGNCTDCQRRYRPINAPGLCYDCARARRFPA